MEIVILNNIYHIHIKLVVPSRQGLFIYYQVEAGLIFPDTYSHTFFSDKSGQDLTRMLSGFFPDMWVCFPTDQEQLSVAEVVLSAQLGDFRSCQTISKLIGHVGCPDHPEAATRPEIT